MTRIKLQTEHTSIFWQITIRGSAGRRLTVEKAPIREWLKVNAPNAKVVDNWPEAYIDFESKDQAIIFKLTF